MADETCGAFRTFDESLDRTVVHRFVVGENAGPKPMSPEAAAAELGDPFATLLLLQGRFPGTAAELFTLIDQATDADDPLRNKMFFLLGEGGQIPLPKSEQLDRSLRFLISCGDQNLPDLIVSAARPTRGLIEVMAWDGKSTGFNYYQTGGPMQPWVWAGNSRHALSDPTRGKGPFESHVSGNFLMKELKAPWVHWQSFDASIPTDQVFSPDELEEVRPWIEQIDEPSGGAFTCEMCVAKPSIRRWTAARFNGLPTESNPDHSRRIIEQLLLTSTANLTSSRTKSRDAVQGDEVPLPNTFFFDFDALAEVLGLTGPDADDSGDDQARFAVSGDHYAAALEEFEVALRDDSDFVQPGDTFFAFVVPERAFEDTEVVRQAVDEERGVLPKDLAAALLMVDFPNPMFSARRARLLDHFPDGVALDELAETFEANILKGAETEESPEAEFAELRAAGDSWKQVFDDRLKDYFRAVRERLSTPTGFADFFRLAEGRRHRFRDLPISEFPLLLADTNLKPADVTDLAMLPDATVVPRPPGD